MPPSAPDAQILALAASSHGVIRRDDARAAGLSDRQIRHRLARGTWRTHSSDVFLVAGSPASPEQALLSAAWSVDGVGSHTSAAWWHGILEEPPLLPHVSTTFDRCRELHGDLMVIHRPSRLPDRDRTRRRGVGVTTVERTLLDLGAVLELDGVRDCIHRALRQRLTHVDRLVARLLQLGGKGRAGTAAARAVLTEFDVDLATLESDLESRLLELIASAGLPLPVLQHPVQLGDHHVRLDMAYPEQMVAIEADGFAVHSGRDTFENDRRRQNALVLAGWKVIRFTWRQVTRAPTDVVADLRAALVERSKRAM